MLKRLAKPISTYFCSKLLPTTLYKNIFHFKINQTFAIKKFQTKQEYMGSIIIKNDNLKFQTSQFDLVLYPFHPQVVKKNANVYQINKLTTVLALNFIPNKIQQGESFNAQSMKANWQNRKSLALRFNQLSRILQVNLNMEKSWVVQTIRNGKVGNLIKRLTIKNVKGNDYMILELQEISKVENKQQKKWSLCTKMNKNNFELMQHLIKESLFDLSGMKLIFDLRRNEQLAKITTKQKSMIDKEDLFKDYDNKENVV